MPSSNIQLATLQDIPAIQALFAACVRVMQAEVSEQWGKDYPSSHIIETDITQQHLYLIRENRQLAAVITLNQIPAPEYAAICWQHSASKEAVLIVHRLAVHPNYRRKGYARQLMLFAEQLAIQKECSIIRLDVYQTNVGATRLYEELGYTKAGKVYLNGRAIPCICYERKIEGRQTKDGKRRMANEGRKRYE